VYLQHAEPAWWARIWYPLRYSTIVRGHAQNYDLNPALLAAVIDEESKFRADATQLSTSHGNLSEITMNLSTDTNSLGGFWQGAAAQTLQ